MKKKAFLIMGAVLLLFIITNPSVKAFKEYIGINTYQGLHRTHNFFVASTYLYNGSSYTGILGNFWITNKPEITSSAEVIDTSSVVIIDTTMIGDNESVDYAPSKRVHSPVINSEWLRRSVEEHLKNKKNKAHNK